MLRDVPHCQPACSGARPTTGNMRATVERELPAADGTPPLLQHTPTCHRTDGCGVSLDIKLITRTAMNGAY